MTGIAGFDPGASPNGRAARLPARAAARVMPVGSTRPREARAPDAERGALPAPPPGGRWAERVTPPGPRRPGDGPPRSAGAVPGHGRVVLVPRSGLTPDAGCPKVISVRPARVSSASPLSGWQATGQSPSTPTGRLADLGRANT